MIQFYFHALRHTHAAMLIESGAYMKDVKHRLGHSKLAITKTHIPMLLKKYPEKHSIF